MNKCTGFMGRIFGHKFIAVMKPDNEKALVDYRILDITWMRSTFESIDYCICQRCGAMTESSDMDEWIKCSERMPEKFTKVLAFEEGLVSIMIWNGGKYWQEANTNDDFHVPTRWRPLPALPEDV